MLQTGWTPATLRLLADFRHRVRGLGGAVERGAQRVARELERQTKENLTSWRMVRSGSLRRSVTSGTQISGGEIAVWVGSSHGAATAYSRAQEEGRSIVPAHAEWLAIPVGPAVTGAGVAKFSSPREAPAELKFIKLDESRAILVATGGLNYTMSSQGVLYSKGRYKMRGGKLVKSHMPKQGVVWYILRRKVTLPATHWLSESLRNGESLMVNWIQAAIWSHLSRQ